MAGRQVDTSWMWHPSFSEQRTDTAGLLVHFRKTLHVQHAADIPKSLTLHVTADTRYKLYVNSQLVALGPVKGDPSLWFYDAVDVAPFLTQGANRILVVVLRFFGGTQYAAAFPRLPIGGLRVVLPGGEEPWTQELSSGTSWETAIDPDTVLRVDEPEDEFLHVYEQVTREPGRQWCWVPAVLHEFLVSTGNSAPWILSPRLIPDHVRAKGSFSQIHNLKSNVDESAWRQALLSVGGGDPIRLEAGSEHQCDLEMESHTTALVRFVFDRAGAQGSVLSVLYSESYEDEPTLVPYLRRKGDRRDTNRSLVGPSDTYHFQGLGNGSDSDSDAAATAWDQEDGREIFSPHHFRTFRFVRLKISVGASDLVLRGIEMETINYDLKVKADLALPDNGEDSRLWNTSIRTLQNCMHDCYEDCPFYEQLQYAMDTRSSILFTYRLSGDDRLARQAIIQLHNSFQAGVGLTASRAPSHAPQFIPNFSLFWVCMLSDHLDHFGDAKFVARFLPVVDAVLGYFDSRIGPLGLVVSDFRSGIWNFTDWANEWRPYGIPPSVERTHISTYTNNLYAYTLRHAAQLLSAVGRRELAHEYLQRADAIISAVRQHCFDGQFFRDSVISDEAGVAAAAVEDCSQLNQAWAVLSGAVRGPESQHLMRRSLDPDSPRRLVQSSVSMAFYTLRALSVAGGSVYDEQFDRFWAPWRAQLALNLTTWEVDPVALGSEGPAGGSAPIYEFMAEVAGVTPAGPGWSAIAFRPRIGLYSRFSASCPLRMDGDAKVVGVAHVSWERDAGAAGTTTTTTRVSLVFDMASPRVLPVAVHLPGYEGRLMDTMSDMSLMVVTDKDGTDDGSADGEERRSPGWEVIG